MAKQTSHSRGLDANNGIIVIKGKLKIINGEEVIMRNLIILSIITGLAFCQEVATTKDGKLVILHDNGTWEYINSSTSETTLQKHTADVYVTKTGKKYHRDGCVYLKKSRRPISIDKAKVKYQPCKGCW